MAAMQKAARILAPFPASRTIREAAAAYLVADPTLAEDLELGRRLRATGYTDEHIVTFTGTGYGLEHPIDCRPDLIGCVHNEWLASQTAPDRLAGRYVMRWDDLGQVGPVYTRAEATRS